MIRICSSHGEIVFGELRIAWQNQDEWFDGFTVVSWGNTALELGVIDQDRNGIYVTRYENGEVLDSKPLFLLQ